jgi:hypothetical protein
MALNGGKVEDGKGPRPLCFAQADPGTGVGIIKSVMGFRQFMLRGINQVRGEWKLVTMAWNMKRTFILCPRQ